MRMSRLVSFMFMAVALLTALPATAGVANNCDTRVVDETGKLGSGLSKVETAADKLAGEGADVRVRIVNSLEGQGNMDQLFETAVRQCPSWQAPGGGRKNNLSVLLLMPVTKPDGSYGAKVGLYHGSQWERALGRKDDLTVITSIIKNDMAPHVRDGRYADGVAAGLDAVTARVSVQSAPPSPQAPVVVQQQPPVVVREEPTDLSGLWPVLFSIVGLGALVLLTILIGRVRKGRAEARAAQQKAKTSKISCAAYVLELDEPLALYEAAVNQAARAVSEEDMAGQRAKLRQAKSDLDGANQRYGELNSAGSATDPDVGGRSVQEYANISTAYDEALSRFRGVKTAAENGRKECADLSRLPDEAKAAIDALSSDIDTSLKSVEGVKAQGFHVEPCEAMLAEAERFYDQAGAAMGRKQFTASKTLSAKGKASADKAQAEAEALPDRKAALDESVAKLEARLPKVKDELVAAKTVADDIVANYAEACFKTVRGNGAEALGRLTGAANAVPAAKDLASMEKQQWSEAEKTVSEADKALDEAVSLLRSITSLKANLERAKADAPGEIQAAKADIAAARAFIKSNASDLNDPLELDLFKQLNEAEQGVAQAETQISERDYPKAVQLALGANKAADKILSRAQDDQQATLRQRRLAEAAVQQAETAISRSKEYIEDHSSVGPYTAREKLEEAKTLLANAKRTADPAARISLAEQSEAAAKASLKSAKDAVKKDQESRNRNWGSGYSSSYGQPRSSGGGGDAFLGALAGSLMGSGLGHGSSSSRGSSSSSSSGGNSIFGGGGGGGFDIGGSSGGGGGGFDIGGGGGGGGGGSSDI